MNANQPELTEDEMTKIRAEVRYAAIAAKELNLTEKKTKVEKILGYLSNGFVLLLIGSLITSWLVPSLQRNYESRKQRIATMQDCLEQFLQYSNSIWEEYYVIIPLTQKLEIDRDEYVQVLKEITQIKLKRYAAYAKVQSLAIVFQETQKDSAPIEESLKKYASLTNSVSTDIDKWLTNLYCTPTKRDRSPCASFDPEFNPYDEYLKIQKKVIQIGNFDADRVAEQMVRVINDMKGES